MHSASLSVGSRSFGSGYTYSRYFSNRLPFIGTCTISRNVSAVTKAWQAMAECVEPDGRLTYVQPVGFAPKKDFDPEHTDAFGVGAVLLAGSEVRRLVGTK